MFKTAQVAKLFQVSPMTIGRWVEAFAPYLSHTAKSTDGTQRRFNDDDLKTLALVWQMREQGNEFELITAALASGERAIPPNASMGLTQTNNQLTLQAQIHNLETELEQERALRHDAEGQVKSLEKQIDKLLDRLLGRE